MTAVLHRSPTSRRGAAVLAAAALSLAVAACTGARPELVGDPDPTTTSSSTTTTEAPPGATVAQAKGTTIDVYPDATSATPSQQITTAEATSAPDIPIVFLVKTEGDDRLEVYLPVRPNGSSGWVRRRPGVISIACST